MLDHVGAERLLGDLLFSNASTACAACKARAAVARSIGIADEGLGGSILLRMPSSRRRASGEREIGMASAPAMRHSDAQALAVAHDAESSRALS